MATDENAELEKLTYEDALELIRRTKELVKGKIDKNDIEIGHRVIIKNVITKQRQSRANSDAIVKDTDLKAGIKDIASNEKVLSNVAAVMIDLSKARE